MPPGRRLRRGKNLWLRVTTASAQCLHSAFFILLCKFKTRRMSAMHEGESQVVHVYSK